MRDEREREERTYSAAASASASGSALGFGAATVISFSDKRIFIFSSPEIQARLASLTA